MLSAFFDDDDFRKLLKPLYDRFQKIGHELLKNLDPDVNQEDLLKSFSISEGLYSYLLSSYHASKACESALQAARPGMNEWGEQISEMMRIQHALGLEAIINLVYAHQFVGLEAVVKITGVDKVVAQNIFDELFPSLIEARNALVHRDDRAMGLFGQGQNKIDRGIAQVPSQAGSKFRDLIKTIRGENGVVKVVRFDFDFSTQKLFKLAFNLAEIYTN
ncbi:MAG: hypothetical protein ABJA10_01845 [Aestuariivirga sp.]